MKNIIKILILLIMLSTSSSLNAQHNSIGLIGGLNFADMKVSIPALQSDFGNNVSSRLVMGIGGVVDINLYKNLYLCIEPMYLQRGGISETIVPGVDLKFKLSFFDIPILLRSEFGNKVRPYILAGPVISFMLSSNMEVVVPGMNFEFDIKEITENRT